MFIVWSNGKKEKLGIRSQYSITNKYFHPRKVIADKYLNQTDQSKLENCVCYKKGGKVIRKKEVDVVFFCHNDFTDVYIYCVPRWVTIVKYGAQHFSKKDDPQSGNGEDKAISNGEEEREVRHEVLCARDVIEDIALVREMGFIVEDDKDLAPKNVPDPGGTDTGGTGQIWGWSGADQQATFGASNYRPKVTGLTGSALECIMITSMFLLFPSEIPRTCHNKRDK